MSSTTIRGLNRDEWLTRDEIAGLMGRTEDTVRRLLRDNALRTRSGENGKVLLQLGDLIDLGKVSESVLDPQVSGPGHGAHPSSGAYRHHTWVSPTRAADPPAPSGSVQTADPTPQTRAPGWEPGGQNRICGRRLLISPVSRTSQ